MDYLFECDVSGDHMLLLYNNHYMRNNPSKLAHACQQLTPYISCLNFPDWDSSYGDAPAQR